MVHPGSIEVATRDRVKTDKRDAKKMATQLAAGRLKGIVGFYYTIKHYAEQWIAFSRICRILKKSC